mmetsp:Transcript_17823/g.38796  ORF Transcript_17823/g.38796 Transcript_17823/m.38796 type:complete len:157 (+) Transcript_17823:774-1244(+)
MVKECQADLNIRNDEGDTPLLLATGWCFSAVVECFVEEGQADVNIPSKDGDTPLLVANEAGGVDEGYSECAKFLEVAKLLVEKGHVEVNFPGKNGYTPLLVACNNFQLEIVQYLVVQRGADLNAANKMEQPLFVWLMSMKKRTLLDSLSFKTLHFR